MFDQRQSPPQSESPSLYLTVLMALIVVFVIYVAGCANTPREQYGQVQDAYIAGVTILLDARTQGEISEEDWQEDILPWINLGDKALDHYDAATQAGVDAGDALTQVRRALQELRPFIIQFATQG